ncbi:MAG TPA: hypothetical protein VD931_07950 [Baekduia sp.]|nr:hypothetical protein [Baekduia sp.]
MPTTIDPNMAATLPRFQASLVIAMMIPATTKMTVNSWVQIQKGDIA